MPHAATYRCLVADIRPTSSVSVGDFEDRMTALLSEGFIPWGMPGLMPSGRNVIVVQHMVRYEDEEDAADEPDDMG